MATYIPRGNQKRQVARSRLFNIDNGAAATIDDVLLRHSQAIKLLEGRIVYTTETAGTVAAANIRIGTTVAGTQIAAATAYTNSAAVGSATAITLVQTEIPANTPVITRHTGIAATAAGEAYVELEYEVLP
jgi:hypothetical protein